MSTIAPVTHGLLLLAAFTSVMWLLSWLFARRQRTKESFLVAGRKVPLGMASFSIAAAWVWAPSMFLSAQKAYQEGFAGLFWFTAPNILCLLLFAPFARILREKVPAGWSLSDYVRERHGNRVHDLYLVQMLGLTVCAFAVQLLAGGKVISWLTGLPYATVTIVLSAIALSYSLAFGLRASIVTDDAKMVFILAAGLVLAPWCIAAAGGLDVVGRGLSGLDGRYGSLVSPAGLRVAFSFGIPTTVGLLAGPFGDQAFWQRAFATERRQVARAFVIAAFVFGLVPLLMSLFGLVAAGKGWVLADASLANVETVRRLLPAPALTVFCAVLLSGLVSTLDSKLCAVSSLTGHDLALRWSVRSGDARSLLAARLGMLALAAAGILIANLPGMQILYLFLFYGTLRASTLLPTIATLLSEDVDRSGVFAGILASFLVGLPLFAYGSLTKQAGWTVAGSLSTVILSGLVTLLFTWRRRRLRQQTHFQAQ